ncbi:oxidoreductase [Brucella anthropi]|uniref:Ldh family oxidoreductase n=1 Tax=Brucella anthropi TaxID=529 RepID=UPI003986E218
MQNDGSIAVDSSELEIRVLRALLDAGASAPSAEAATRAMMHASLVGVDSHGVRLVEHYCRVLAGGRLAKDPQLVVEQKGAASALIHGGDGLGHYAMYRAVEIGADLASQAGVAGVGITHSSHIGAAGAYALEGAQRGFITLATTNTDSIVSLFDGSTRFHGTNPFAIGAPVPGEDPWLLDMATSSIPMNRVMLYRSLNKTLPDGVAADNSGRPTIDPNEAEMLLPLGGTDFGFKGAALAGLATLLSAVLTGSTLDTDFIPMYGSDDISTPRNMGHFVLVIDPAKFAGAEIFASGIKTYLAALRSAPSREGGGKVMAPGDREWAERSRREGEGIPIDRDTAKFLGFLKD